MRKLMLIFLSFGAIVRSYTEFDDVVFETGGALEQGIVQGPVRRIYLRQEAGCFAYLFKKSAHSLKKMLLICSPKADKDSQ